jgi:hypothetical protein
VLATPQTTEHEPQPTMVPSMNEGNKEEFLHTFVTCHADAPLQLRRRLRVRGRS